MKGKVEYIIRIEADSSVQSSGETAAAASPSGQSASVGLGGMEKYFTKMAAYGYAKSAINRFVANDINTVEIRTGNAQMQRQAQSAYEIGSRVWNFGESIVVGAATGGVWGALIGAAISTTNTLMDLTIERNNLNIARSIEGIGLERANIRAGAGSDRIGRST